MAIIPALTNQTSSLTNIGSSDILQVGAGISSSNSTLTIQANGTTVVSSTSSLITLSKPLLLQGSNPSTTGDIRAVNATTIISARNAANNANIPIIATDSSNNILIGDASVTSAIQIIGTGTMSFVTTIALFRDTPGFGTAFSITPASTGTTTLQYASGVTAPIFNQANNTSNGGIGTTLTIQAQNATGTAATGGILALTSGTGTSSSGALNLQLGGSTKVSIVSSGIAVLLNLIQFNATMVSPTISQGDVNTNGATGSAMIIQAQNAAGTTSNGGTLFLTSGTGTTAAGPVSIQTGGVSKLTVAPTTITIGDASVANMYLESTNIYFRDNSAGVALTLTPNSGGSNILQYAVASIPFLNQATVATNNATGATFIIQAQNATGTSATGGALTLTSGTGTTVAGNLSLQTGGVTGFIITPTTARSWSQSFIVGQTDQTTRITITPATATTFVYDASNTSSTYSQATQTSDTTVANLTFSPQAPFATATGTNRTPGSLIVDLALPTNSGASEGRFKVTRNSSHIFSISALDTNTTIGSVWLGPGITPSATNATLFSTGAGLTYLNTASGGLIALAIGGNSANAGSVVMGAASFAWAANTASLIISQTTDSTNGITGQPLTIQAQNATGTTTTGGALNLTSGSGTSTSGSVNIQTGGTSRMSVSSSSVLIDYGTAGRVILRPIVSATSYGAIYLGIAGGSETVQNYALGSDGSDTRLNSTSSFSLCINNTVKAALTSSGLALFNSTGSFGGSTGTLFIANAAAVPTSDPTGGGILYVESGSLKYRGSSGTITTIASA